MILGDTFMRNVYTLFHFGDKLTMRQGNRAPHIQLLSVSLLSSVLPVPALTHPHSRIGHRP